MPCQKCKFSLYITLYDYVSFDPKMCIKLVFQSQHLALNKLYGTCTDDFNIKSVMLVIVVSKKIILKVWPSFTTIDPILWVSPPPFWAIMKAFVLMLMLINLGQKLPWTFRGYVKSINLPYKTLYIWQCTLDPKMSNLFFNLPLSLEQTW